MTPAATSSPAAEELAAAALATLGPHDGVAPIADGMSSAAWLGVVDGRRHVVRVPKNDGRRPPPRYRAEARLLCDLADRGAPVAQATVVEIGGAECSVALELPGRPVGPDDWSPELLDQLRAALAIVHATPAALAVEPDVVRRFHLARIWPFDGSDLGDHPAIARWPARTKAIAARQDDILAAGAAPACVVHTDLHRDHLLVADGRLAGILDFVDAFAGPAGWDDASLRYYHGDRVAGPPTEEARLLGIAFALYKLDKTPDRADVVQRVDALLRLSLELAPPT